jgi:tetratricopeptide (TPR) repeat protein
MQKNLILFFFLCCSTALWSQTKPLPSDPTKWTMEDMKRFAAMSPAEQADLKKKMLQQAEGQLKQAASAANIKLDETVLPTTQLQPPVKDLQRLATIPVTPPTRQQLLQNVSKMEAALKTTLTPQAVQKVEEFVADKSIKEIQSAAVGGFYADNPQAGLLLGMKAVQKESTDVVGWNNLAALMNMTGLEHQAIPILQNCLQEHPESSMLLNNMGQAFMGLGDLVKSKEFLQRCLKLDELHPEANRSMALIYLFGNDMANALKHLEKEFQIGQRKSSLAYLVKSGQRNKINLAALRKRKMQMDGTDNRDFFSEISLEKFKIPEPPASSKLTMKWREENAPLFKSISDEMLFWMKESQFTAEEIEADGKTHFGLYHDLVDELIQDLGDQYIPLFAYITEDDLGHLNQLHYDYMAKDKAIECPDSRGLSVEAFNKICCDLKTPAIDDLMNKYNSFISKRVKEAQSNYKQYINGLISIVQLDPSIANKRLVYTAVSQYFSWLSGAIGAYLIKEPYMNCYDTKLTSEEAQGMLESARNIDLQCPSWLKIDVSLKVAKLKGDCNGFNVEADVYKLINVGLEKKFKTGTSTLYVGAGIKGSFKGLASGSIKQQFYVVFDQNNEFADLGMRGSASGDLASGMIGAEFGYDFSMNSGFNAQGKVKSNWITNYEKALNFVAK